MQFQQTPETTHTHKEDWQEGKTLARRVQGDPKTTNQEMSKTAKSCWTKTSLEELRSSILCSKQQNWQGIEKCKALESAEGER